MNFIFKVQFKLSLVNFLQLTMQGTKPSTNQITSYLNEQMNIR